MCVYVCVCAPNSVSEFHCPSLRRGLWWLSLAPAQDNLRRADSQSPVSRTGGASVYVNTVSDTLPPIPPPLGTVASGRRSQGPAFRGIDVQLAPELYMPGHIVTWRSFASATTSAKVAREFLSKPKQEDAAPSGTLFILECMTAHCVQSVSVLPSEEEVLFGLNTQLRVLSRVSGGSMKLLEQAMELDLANTRVCHRSAGPFHCHVLAPAWHRPAPDGEGGYRVLRRTLVQPVGHGRDGDGHKTVGAAVAERRIRLGRH